MFLTKSDFITFLDSPLHLWARENHRLDPHKPNLYRQHLSRQGYQVQKLAREFLTHKVATEYPNAQISFEVDLIDGNYESRIDALVHDKIHDTYDLYEIKSGTSIHKEHEYDVTFQYLVGKQQVNVHKIYLVRLNREFVREGEFDLDQLFIVDDMMPVVEKLKDEVLLAREEAWQILTSADAPLAQHCYKPKDCPCKSLCHPDLEDFSIYDLGRGTQKQFKYFLDIGCKKLVDIPDDFVLNPLQTLQKQSAREERPIIDKPAISRELSQLEFPLFFLDYETFGAALPIHDRYRPYQDIVFQYSIHRLDAPESDFKHYEYLVTETDEPSGELVKRLVEVLGDSGSVIVWNKSFERSRNTELAKLQPDFAAHLEGVNERIYDLMDCFKKGYYVDYRFHGSCSIKQVLPVLVPHLSYEGMSIGEGTAAMIAWYQLTHDTHSFFTEDSLELKASIKENLLAYCELDTRAMVEIWRVLKALGDA